MAIGNTIPTFHETDSFQYLHPIPIELRTPLHSPSRQSSPAHRRYCRRPQDPSSLPTYQDDTPKHAGKRKTNKRDNDRFLKRNLARLASHTDTSDNEDCELLQRRTSWFEMVQIDDLPQDIFQLDMDGTGMLSSPFGGLSLLDRLYIKKLRRDMVSETCPERIEWLDFIVSLESEYTSWISWCKDQNRPDILRVDLEFPHQRLLFHMISRFYGLQSWSQDEQDGRPSFSQYNVHSMYPHPPHARFIDLIYSSESTCSH